MGAITPTWNLNQIRHLTRAWEIAQDWWCLCLPLFQSSARRSRGEGRVAGSCVDGAFRALSLSLEGRSRELPGPVWNTRPAMSCSLSLLTCSPLARETCDTRIQIWRSSPPDEERAITKINPEPCSFFPFSFFSFALVRVRVCARASGYELLLRPSPISKSRKPLPQSVASRCRGGAQCFNRSHCRRVSQGKESSARPLFPRAYASVLLLLLREHARLAAPEEPEEQNSSAL